MDKLVFSLLILPKLFRKSFLDEKLIAIFNIHLIVLIINHG